MSDRDPQYVSLLIKTLLKRRTHYFGHRRLRDAKSLLERIGNLIARNRSIELTESSRGTSKWWQKVKDIVKPANKKPEKMRLEELNEHFADINTDPSYIFTPKRTTVTEIPPITTAEVHQALKRLKKTASGADGLPLWFLKEYADELSRIIATVFNQSMIEGKVPILMKSVKILPIPKNNNPKARGDYRPVSVNPILARLLERIIVHKYLASVTESHLSNSQFAFRNRIWLDNKLTFETHITKKANMANGMIAIIKKSFTKVTKQIFLNIYKCLIRPHLEIAILIWHPRLIKHQKNLENVQRRATRLISGIKNLSYYKRLKELNLSSLEYRRKRGTMMEMYKICYGFYDRIVNAGLFVRNDRDYRGNACKAVVRKPKLEMRKTSSR